ncbi:MAG: hypothetical protein IIW01_03160, partial [Thermoguttaceae bacterium]|nr:hypothetical protein [Thermoguttaceae bacterium]
MTSAALALGAADRGASQCFWRRWREARRAPSVRTFYAPTVVGCAPSTSVWAVPQTISVARPIAAAPVCSTFPSAPIASAPVCATGETAASVAYPTECVSTSSCVSCETNDVCESAATCSDVCAPCGEASTTCVETEYKEEEITTYETVWDNVTRYRDKTITRQVPETSIKREKVKVERPVWETVEKETTYDVTRYVPETSTQTRTRTTLRPVVQNRERKIVETVMQPVVETVTTQRSYV